MLRKIAEQPAGALSGRSGRSASSTRRSRFHLEQRDREERRGAACRPAEARRAAPRASSAASTRRRTSPATRAARCSLETVLQDVRYGCADAAQEPGLRGRGDPDARPRHRRQHRDLLRRPRRAAAVAAVRRRRPARPRARRTRRARASRTGASRRSEIEDYRDTEPDARGRRRVPLDVLRPPRADRARARPDGRRLGQLLRRARRAAASSGRTFLPGEDKNGAEAVLVLSARYWMRRFGGDPSVVGRVFEMNDRPHTVIGVLPPIPGYPEDNDVYMPVSACPFRSDPDVETNRQRGMLEALRAAEAGRRRSRRARRTSTRSRRTGARPSRRDYPAGRRACARAGPAAARS